MASSNRDAWTAMESKLMQMGGIVGAVLGEPRSGIQSGLVAIIPVSGEINEVTLSSPREIHRVILRRYERIEQQPQAEIEMKLDDWRAQILEDIFGDFDLGGTVAYPVTGETVWEYGFGTLANADWRVLDVLVAYRIDDNATFVK